MIVKKEIKRENGDVLQVTYKLCIECFTTSYTEFFSATLKPKGKKVFKPISADARVYGKDKHFLTEEEILEVKKLYLETIKNILGL